MTLDEAIQHAREVAQSGCSECCKEHAQLAEWLEELRDRRAAPDHELISRREAIEAVKHDLDWLGSRDGPAAVSALMRLRVFDPVYELNKRYPGYSVLPRDCIERTLGVQSPRGPLTVEKGLTLDAYENIERILDGSAEGL